MNGQVEAPRRLVVLAPNWLGDAVMALPLVADLRRAWPDSEITVAGRGAVAALFQMVDDVASVVTLEGTSGLSAVAAAPRNARRLAEAGFDAALLLPNSFAAAWTARHARIPERWGFATDRRSRLLTRAWPKPRRHVHQAEYYQALSSALGVTAGPRHARVTVTDDAAASARALLLGQGLQESERFVAMAPGAAYGRAKQWLPERFAELAALLASERQVRTVLVGAKADAPVCGRVAELAAEMTGLRSDSAGATRPLDLAGQTDLPTLAAVLQQAAAVVSNDSGAMHLAGAVGARVIAVFGATDDTRTSPLAAGRNAPLPVVVSTNVWCRPCMLRECPIDHRCMTGVSARHVLERLAL